MKTPLLLLATLIAATGSSFAQMPTSAGPAAVAQKSPDQQAQRRVQYLAKELGLSADQQAKLEPILAAQRADMMAMRNQVQTGGRRRGTGQDLKASQAKYTEQLRGVLTPEQFAKFEQLKDEQRDKLRERRASGQGGQAGQ